MNGVHTAMTNTDTPVEAFERAYPVRVLRYRSARGAGAGCGVPAATASTG